MTHPEHVGCGRLVAALLRDEGDGVIESVLEQARTKARACRDAARHHHAAVEICWMLEEFTVSGPHGPRQETVVHGEAGTKTMKPSAILTQTLFLYKKY